MTYVRHCKEHAPIYMYYVAPEMPKMSSVIADCPDLVPPNILDKSTPVSPTEPYSSLHHVVGMTYHQNSAPFLYFHHRLCQSQDIIFIRLLYPGMLILVLVLVLKDSLR